MKRNFLVVVANVPLREALAGSLRNRGYTVTRAVSGAEAERAVRNVRFDAALVESHLPDITAEELRSRLQKWCPDCRTVILSGFELVRRSAEQLQFGRDDYLLREDQLLDLLSAPYATDGRGPALSFNDRGTAALIQVIDVLVGVLELDERFFGGSSHVAMRLAREVAEVMASDGETVQEVVLATLLRDIGKVGVDPAVFTEEGHYSDEQREKMREHVSASVRLFEHIHFPWKVLPVIRAHHERYDGTGYPDGLRGREIPIGARIVAVVDAYVALTSERPHRQALNSDDALQTLIRHAGRQFDPEIVEAFQKVLDKRLTTRKGKKKKPKVLIMEAHDDFRRVLKMRLLNEGLEVEEAESAEDALIALLRDPPDLAMLDLDADSSQAFALLEEVRDDPALSRTPVVFLSSKSDRVLKIRALRDGVDDFLCKGDDLEELIARVENVLAREARREGAYQRPRRGITGDLENLAMPDIIQTLVMGMKSACVTVRSGKRSGKIWFDNGQAKHAKLGRTSGESAFIEMVQWTEGEFVIEHGVESKTTTLERDAMFLLMEAMRIVDESGRGSAQAS